MRFGVVFPQTEIDTDPMVIRDYAQAAEELGYQHILAYDHVIGANPASRPGWRAPYTHQDMFHEPFVLFGYLAGLTKKIELVTGVIILPQRQTVLVAKQASAGIPSNTKPWVKTSRIGAAGPKSKSRSCASSGLKSWLHSMASGIPSRTQARIRCRFNDPFRFGSAAETTGHCAVWRAWATAGFHCWHRTIIAELRSRRFKTMPLKRGAIRAVLVSKDELHSGKVLRRGGSRTSTLGRSSARLT